MYIAVLVGLVCLSIGLQVFAGVVGLWFSQIIFFDSALTGVAAGMACNHFAHIHPAICIVIGLAAFFLIFMFQTTTIGFWVIGGLFTLAYASAFGLIAYSEGDMIWGVVVFGLTILIVGGLHLHARNQLEE